VFVPAYAIMASGLLLPWTATVLGAAIVVSSALYFADRRMKTSDNHFRGFPALWNVAAFYLFLLQPPPAAASLAVLALIILTFVPLHVIHPVRVKRWRQLNLALIALWGVLALVALAQGFVVGWPVTFVLSAIGLYIVGADAVIRLFTR
jgi:phosphatidylcholine synthase